YLVRRLLENTSNESFVRRRFVEGRDLDELLAPPSVTSLPEPDDAPVRGLTDERAPAAYEPEPPAEWRRRSVRSAFASSVANATDAIGREVPAMIDGRA